MDLGIAGKTDLGLGAGSIIRVDGGFIQSI
jgi:hypothetical protein